MSRNQFYKMILFSFIIITVSLTISNWFSIGFLLLILIIVHQELMYRVFDKPIYTEKEIKRKIIKKFKTFLEENNVSSLDYDEVKVEFLRFLFESYKKEYDFLSLKPELLKNFEKIFFDQLYRHPMGGSLGVDVDLKN